MFSQGDFSRNQISPIANGNISNLTFMDEVKMINFDVYNEDQLIVLKIPFTLLLNPFDVYFTDDEDTELNQTCAWWRLLCVSGGHRGTPACFRDAK